MKHVYPATLSMIVGLFLMALSLNTSAQTYSATYTTTPVLAGSSPYNWSTTSGVPIWDPTKGQPPAACSNCLIKLIGPGTIHLNTTQYLTNNSSLEIGPGVTLEIDNSGATAFGSSYGIFMDQATTNTIVLTDGTSILNAKTAGTYDGVFAFLSSTPITYNKDIGNSPSQFLGNNVTQTTNPVDGNLAAGFQTFNSGDGTLPIILADFTAAVNQGAVDLNWSTASESNSDHFAIQRSADAGNTWTNIGTVAAAGNSAVTLNYSYVDSKPVQGTNEYRLQLVDKDGSYTYSQVVGVRIGALTSVSIYPNPATNYVNVTLGGNAGENVLIQLYNQTGALLLVKNVSNAGGTVVPIAVSNYPEGNYVIVVSAADGSRQVTKLLVTR
jgi:hypothetical protein